MKLTAIPSKPIPRPKIIYYHQTHYHQNKYIPILPAAPHATHIIIAAIHLNAPDNITLNDDPYTSPRLAPLWADIRTLQREHGVKVLGMLGGAAQGSFTKLDGSLEGFERWYAPLRSMVAWAGLDGLDLDVEEAMSLGGLVRLIDHLKTDFGQEFLITLAPVAPALLGFQNLGGFNFQELDKAMGARIAWYNIQFYCGWGHPRDARRILEHGWPPEKVVVGLVTNPDNGAGWVRDAELEETLRALLERWPGLGGVMGWEWFNAVTGGEEKEPWRWAEMVSGIFEEAAGKRSRGSGSG